MAYTSYVYLTLFLGITFLLYTIFPKKYKWVVFIINELSLLYCCKSIMVNHFYPYDNNECLLWSNMAREN